jgi:outer membrane immunogenic protein
MQGLRAVALALLLAGLAAPAASAADLGQPRRGKIARPEPVPVPVLEEVRPFSWTGFYAGAHAGYGWSDIDASGVFGASSRDGEGWLAGGQIGYNFQVGRLVYGIEADISSAWIDGDNGCCGHSVDWLYSVRGRAGLTSHDGRWLFYGTAGAAWADIDFRSVGFAGHSDTHFGWVAGGGVERALAPNLTARVEYLYYDFDSVSAPAGALGGAATDLDPSMHTVRFGLNFKF